MRDELFNRVENSVAKGETAHDEQSIFFPKCSQKPSAAEASESVCMGETIKSTYIVYTDFNSSSCISWRYLLNYLYFGIIYFDDNASTVMLHCIQKTLGANGGSLNYYL